MRFAIAIEIEIPDDWTNVPLDELEINSLNPSANDVSFIRDDEFIYCPITRYEIHPDPSAVFPPEVDLDAFQRRAGY